ncbi:MAG: Na+/H+ antiporter NhaC [Calditrichota bacterium]
MKKPTFLHALLPILVLLLTIAYGLIIRPQLQNLPAFPLEIVFIIAAAFAVAELSWLGFEWHEIQKSIVAKLSSAMPAFFILLTIGIIIGSWMVCGTIPMLVYYGLKTIHPNVFYLLAFLIPIIFSILTGTSWGSVGSIGIVMIGIAGAMGANLAITAGAIIGGAFFGDKMSPLSDTTNMAAIATDVDLYDHIRSMMVTTFPSAIIAAIAYTVLGFVYPPEILSGNSDSLVPFLNSLESIFQFNILLIAPPLIILYGSITGKPILPTMIVSALVAVLLSLVFQPFGLSDIFQSMYKGFHTSMATWVDSPAENVQTLLNRGGLYALIDAVIIAFTVFFFIGAIDLIDAMPKVVNRIFRSAKSRVSTILSSLAATAVTNALTCNQYATSFIVGDAFKKKYDDLAIPRPVLSRSLEDAGTMLESLVPWTPTAVFMVATLGVPYSEYWQWQLLSLVNLIIAPLIAVFVYRGGRDGQKR